MSEEQLSVDLSSFDSILSYLAEIAAGVSAGTIEPQNAKALVSICDSARNTIADKAKYQQAIRDLEKALSSVQRGNEPRHGDPFKVPGLSAGQPALM